MENLGIDPSFWRGKRVFVTGHAGFKGSWLSLWLLDLGANVFGYSLPPSTTPSLFESLGLAKQCDGVFADVRDYDSLHRALTRFSPEIIFHLAAQPLVRMSYSDPIETFGTNVMGTANLLDAARQCENLRSVVNITTDKCYENVEWDWGYRESDTLGGNDPYSSSKACSEIVTNAYRRSFFKGGANVATARAGNIIGGGDWSEDRLIPDAVRAFAERKPVVIRNPHSIRPWQNVLDCVRGYLLLAQKTSQTGGDRFAEAWNFGPDPLESHTVGEVITQFTELFGRDATWVHQEPANQPKESVILKLDPTKALLHLGWRTLLDFKSSVELTAKWYQYFYFETPPPAQLADFSLAQIQRLKGMK